MRTENRFLRPFCHGMLLSAILISAASKVSTQTAYPDPEKSNSLAQGTTGRYANMPDAAVPYRNFTKPYKEWFITQDTLAYNGAARERSSEEVLKSDTVNIGFLGPLESNPESPYGVAMLHGAQLAIEDANAKGGFKPPGTAQGKPYVLKVHPDSPQWGASSTEAVKMVFDEHVAAVLGAVDGATTHIMLRVALKLEFPIIDTATTDPTVTETRIPWLIHNFPDDRQQGYALAQVVFMERKLKRIGIIRTQSRYARVGVEKFSDEAKRLGHVPILEVKFDRGAQDFSPQLRMLKNAHVDGVVIWGEALEAARILKQMKGMGIEQPVFGSSRLCYPLLVESAGAAAEGLITTAAIDPTRTDAAWVNFQKAYRAQFDTDPDAYAAYAYDGIHILIRAIEKAGLNRGQIMDALRENMMHNFDGVAGPEHFDYTLNNITPPSLARVENGKFVYCPSKTQTETAVK